MGTILQVMIHFQHGNEKVFKRKNMFNICICAYMLETAHWGANQIICTDVLSPVKPLNRNH